jgi:hypothetical protein
MNRKNKALFVVAMAMGLVLQGCAHSAIEKRIDGKIAQENGVQSTSDLTLETTKVIKNAPGLTDEQRTRLMQLSAATRAKVDDMRVQSLKLRAVLVKDLITPKDNQGEVEIIKQRIKNVENERLSAMFNAVEQANSILGHRALENRELMNEFFEGHGSRD